ncbi:MAG: peptidyl-prolyl cis-trans isomerase, partial [Candidatus Omnitrophota bacterium]
GIKNLGIIAIFFIAIFVSGCNPHDKQCRSKEVVARINNYCLSVDDFKNEAMIVESNKSFSSDAAGAKQELLQEIINKELLIQEAQKLNFDKEKPFMKEIERYWEQALLKFLLKKKSDELNRTIQVSKPEIEKEYQRMGKRFFVQILVLKNKAAADKLSKAGENFETIKNSLKSEIISEQGPLWMTVGDLPLNLEDLLYSLKSGQVSVPVKYSLDNWAIIKVLNENALALEPLGKIADQINLILLRRKKDAALEKWVEEIRNNAKVKINQEILDRIKL